ncbi:MAG: hypothetical protein LUF26_00045 [Firmicutes bacterium]|nr:hypothetical protein [Bacillota bacterium]
MIPNGIGGVESEKEKLAEVMLEYGIEWDKKGTHERHKSVSEFKRDKLVEEVEILEDKKREIETDISTYKKSENAALATVQKLEDEALQLPEPPPLMSAKTYKTKHVEPFVRKLIKTIKNLARRCIRAEKAAEQAEERISKVQEERDYYKAKAWDLSKENSRLKIELRDFDRIKEYLGGERVQEMLRVISKTRTQRRDRSDTER